MENILQQLTLVLQGPLPGEVAQFKMAPQHRAKRADQGGIANFRPSAVMVLLCEDQDGNFFIPLTKRHAYAGVHSAQVSFPGGKFEPDDGDLASTAKRECYEEIGIADIEILGQLSPLHIPVSGFIVQPFVGKCLLKEPQFELQAREVQKLLRLNPLELLKADLVKEGYIEIGEGQEIFCPWFEVENERVWGATAMMLSEFKEILKTIY